jgi:nucleoside-diphosphate-sugar epimerase
VHRAVRNPAAHGADHSLSTFAVGDIGTETDWMPALAGVTCVVHLAARTHVLEEAPASDSLAEYRRINVAATRHLARQSATAGARRLVFLSSIKVNGESTSRHPYAEHDAPRPEDAYGISKWEAEQELGQVAALTGLETVVLRPPLVYGPRVKANFLRLLALVARRTPLPLASLDNRRSLIYVGNLASAIHAALAAPQAAGRTYLVSDGEDVSTPGLVRAIAQALDVQARLFACPVPVLRAAAALLGRSAELARLAGSLQIDASRIRRELAWQPPYTLAQSLAETARWYRETVNGEG